MWAVTPLSRMVLHSSRVIWTSVWRFQMNYHVMSLEDLIAAKEALGREKDLLAAKELRAIAAKRKSTL